MSACLCECKLDANLTENKRSETRGWQQQLYFMQFLFYLARLPFGRLFIGWFFAHMSFVIPVNRLRDTETLLAFHHPKPSYPIHIVLVPKKAITGLTDLQPEDDIFLAEIFRVAQELVKELDLTTLGYRLLVNGGEYQDVPQLHFHLISGELVTS